MLVEDAPLLRQELRRLIETSGVARVVAEAGSVAAALFLLPSTPVDAVVLRGRLWDGDGGTVLTEVKRLYPGCLVLVLTRPSSPAEQELCMSLGADQILDMSRELERLPDALAALKRGLPGPAA